MRHTTLRRVSPTNRETNCPICGQVAGQYANDFPGFHVNCPKCGQFCLEEDIHEDYEQEIRQYSWIISSAIREINDLQNKAPVISTEEDFIYMKSFSVPSLLERAEKLLLYIHESTTGYMEFVHIFTPIVESKTWSKSDNDLNILAEILKRYGYIEEPAVGGNFMLTIDGYLHVENLKQKVVKANQVFVAMSFSAGRENIFDGIKRGIEAAGYKAKLVDDEPFLGKICDRVIADIRLSAFMVADFTGQKHNVYYEAGYAAGLNKFVILTCQKQDVDRDPNNTATKPGLAFDTRQYRHIIWDTPDQLATELKDTILANIGSGPDYRN